MTSRADARRRRGEKRPIDLEDLDPREGLWRFAFSWFKRPRPAPAASPPPIESIAPDEVAPPLEEEGEAPKPMEAPKRRRSSRRESGPELRRRAFSWLTRAPWRPAVEAPGQRPAPDEEEPKAAPGPSKRRRGAKAKAEAEPALWRRAFLWFRERRAAPAEAKGTSQAGVFGSDVARAHLKGVLEALIFASEHPLPAREVARLARAEPRVVKLLLAELVADYHHRGFRLDEVAGGFVFRTSPAFAPFVREQAAKKPVKMSRAQLETLAIVAYRQPITRPEVDDVRGVDSGAVLKSLLERELVRILGKKDEPGRPMLYGTTAQFLEFFGLRQLADLPTLREFTELSDESKRAYERELGEAAPAEGLMGGEGTLRDPREFEFDPTVEEEAGTAAPDPAPDPAPAPEEKAKDDAPEDALEHEKEDEHEHEDEDAEDEDDDEDDDAEDDEDEDDDDDDDDDEDDDEDDEDEDDDDDDE